MKKLLVIASITFGIIMFFGCETESKEVAPPVLTKIENAEGSNTTVSPIAPPDPDYTGDFVDKYPNGVIKFSGFYRFGKRHGQWFAFYDTGIKWSECFYDNGNKQGASNIFYPNGNLERSGWFKNDLQDSIWIFYDINKKEFDRRAYRKGEETGLVK